MNQYEIINCVEIQLALVPPHRDITWLEFWIKDLICQLSTQTLEHITYNAGLIHWRKYAAQGGVALTNKTDVERRQTLSHPWSINPNMINHVPQQSPLIF